jgi:hypothetical protein
MYSGELIGSYDHFLSLLEEWNGVAEVSVLYRQKMLSWTRLQGCCHQHGLAL